MVLAVVAALKLTVLGALGIKTWEQLKGEELLPVPKALAAAPAAKAGTTAAKDAAKAAKDAVLK